ncbi:ribosomal protein S10 [Paenibacillus sp. RC254]|uniref:hypothetical protein n=1 Tax=unclassified Paenibacillus TaxID=185978 RepID=UPI0024B87AD2|nr:MULTISPECIES: hypothetical protein [unclassified Paenibacillus]
MKKWQVIAIAENTLFALKGQIPDSEYESFWQGIERRSTRMKKAELYEMFAPIHKRYFEIRER